MVSLRNDALGEWYDFFRVAALYRRGRREPVQKNQRTCHEILRVESEIVYKVRAMSIWNPALRPSAAQMILEHFNGEGLSTPPDQVQAYDSASTFEQWVSLPKELSLFNGFPAIPLDQVALMSAEFGELHIGQDNLATSVVGGPDTDAMGPQYDSAYRTSRFYEQSNSSSCPQTSRPYFH